MQVCLSTNIECSYSMCLFSVVESFHKSYLFYWWEKGLFPEVGGFCLGVGGLCPGVGVGSLSGGGGSLSRGALCQGDPPPPTETPRTVTCGRYASYWNAFLISLITPVTRFILVAFRLSQNKFHGCDCWYLQKILSLVLQIFDEMLDIPRTTSLLFCFQFF